MWIKLPLPALDFVPMENCMFDMDSNEGFLANINSLSKLMKQTKNLLCNKLRPNLCRFVCILVNCAGPQFLLYNTITL